MLESKVKFALKQWQKNRPDAALPGTIFIFRDGIAINQFEMAFRNACKAYDYSHQFVFIVATKRHHKRFFSDNYQNISVSSIIEKCRAGVTEEWFQQSANSIKGTAKPPNFSVLINEPNFSEDELQSFCAYLCFKHQIVSAPISLPIPVQVAHEMAKRGGNNMEQWIKCNQVPQCDNIFDFLIIFFLTNLRF